jgi:hypothetical protein
MKAEFTLEELKKGIRNPFYAKLNKEVLVSVRNEDYQMFLDAARTQGEKVMPEDIMRRCLADYANILREHN